MPHPPNDRTTDPPETALHRGQLYDLPDGPLAGELFDELWRGDSFRLERIVSTGQATPAGEWYDQTDDEWVVLLAGSATLRFAAPDETLDLHPGDWLRIPARRRHRVERTAAGGPTVWLALHAKRASPPPT